MIFSLDQLPMQFLVFPDHPLLKSVEIMLDQIMKYPLEHRPPKVYPGAESLLLQALDFFSAATDKKTDGAGRKPAAGERRHCGLRHCGLRHRAATRSRQTKVLPLPLNLNLSTGVVLVTR